MTSKSRLEGTTSKDNYNTQTAPFKSNIAASSLAAKRAQGHKKSQSIELGSSFANQLAQKVDKHQLAGGNSRNTNLMRQKSSNTGKKAVGRSSYLDQNYDSTSKTLAATNPVTPNKNRTRNDTSKAGLRNNSQSVSKLSLGVKAKSSVG